MEIFIIHCSEDSQYISSIQKNICNGSKLNYLEGIHSKWKFKAKQMIEESDLIILIGGKLTETNKNVLWEVKVAKKLNKKIYAIKFDNSFSFSGIETKDLSDLKGLTNEKSLFEKSLFNENKKENIALLEQYKIMIQTSEALVERRQTVNTFFLSANILLSTLMGVFINKKLQEPTKYFEYYFCVVCLIGIVLNNSWSNLLRIYGQLNTGKFKVIQSIEKKLPCSLFSAEWLALGEGNNPKKYKSFTKSEQIIPRIFALVYLVILVYITGYLITSYIK